MLRTRDLLLTFAAICLLVASLDVRSRVIRASALAFEPELNSSANASQNPADRKSEARVNKLMEKVMRNLEQQGGASLQASSPHRRAPSTASQPEGSQADAKNHNSYNYYANETSQIKNHIAQVSGGHERAAQEVRVDFLRSASQEASRRAGRGDSKSPALLYMLGRSAPISNRLEEGEGAAGNEIETSAQQQQPPIFTMLPPYNQQQQPDQRPLQPFSLDNPQIRQILLNYQRNPQATVAQFQSNPHYQRLAQQAMAAMGQPPPAPAGDQLRKEAPERKAAQPAPQQQPGGQAQQPFSPLQLITAPFQAFLPALTGQPQPGAQSKPARPSSQPETSEAPQSVPGLLNPFAPAPGQLQQQQQFQQPPQLPNLQTLYQQLPLYQALLAARQRQEALQAAEKVRQRQQQPPPRSNPNGDINNTNGNNGHPSPPYLNPAPVPLAPFVFPQPLWPNNQQFGQAGQPPPPPSPLPSPPPQAAGEPQSAVQFDDEAAQPAAPSPPPTNAPVPNPAPDNEGSPEDQTNTPAGSGGGGSDQAGAANNGDENAGTDQQQDNNDDANNDSNNNADQNNDNANQANGGGAEQAEPPRQPEEDDPDLKQFQNLADGGDAFTDLFPPGILSNNDINEIKKQQEEQARKQAQEERQRQRQPAGQEQPMNQYQDQAGQPQAPGEENNEQPDQANDNNQDDAGQGDSNDEPGDHQGDSPQAEALTAKTKTNADRYSKSPGVVYN